VEEVSILERYARRYEEMRRSGARRRETGELIREVRVALEEASGRRWDERSREPCEVRRWFNRYKRRSRLAGGRNENENEYVGGREGDDSGRVGERVCGWGEECVGCVEGVGWLGKEVREVAMKMDADVDVDADVDADADVAVDVSASRCEVETVGVERVGVEWVNGREGEEEGGWWGCEVYDGWGWCSEMWS
jgi:hypothetical protein